MNKQNKIFLTAGILGLMIFVVWLFEFGNKEPDKKKTFVSSSWEEKYGLTDKNPRGLYLFSLLAKTHIEGGNQLVEIKDGLQLDTLAIANSEKKTFLFVGENFGLKTEEFETVLTHVKSGSDLFLSFTDLTENLYPKLFKEYNVRYDYASEIIVHANRHNYRMINLFQNDTIAKNWMVFGKTTYNNTHKSISSFMGMDNCVKINMGDGKIYLHTTPSVFFNYQLKRRQGFQYAVYVLDQLPKDRDIYLLELGRLTENYGNVTDAFTDETSEETGRKDDSYLRLLFENTTLLSAFLLAFLGLILFVIFRSKRMRPIVLFQEKKKDMTLAFAETITSIYFAKRNPHGLLQVQKKNFYSAIHKHFFLDIQRRKDDRVLQSLAEKSNTPRAEIDSLVHALEVDNEEAITEQFIAEISQKKREFYYKTGIISENLNQRIQERELVFRRSLWLPGLFIFGGIFLIILGVYYLMGSIGIGVVLWPVGILLIIIGSLRMSNPYMKINKDEIIYFSSLARKYKYHKDDLVSTDIKSKGVVLHFKDGKQLIINYWDLSHFDAKQFKRVISKLHTGEL
jgi:hypothetical protein